MDVRRVSCSQRRGEALWSQGCASGPALRRPDRPTCVPAQHLSPCALQVGALQCSFRLSRQSRHRPRRVRQLRHRRRRPCGGLPTVSGLADQVPGRCRHGRGRPARIRVRIDPNWTVAARVPRPGARRWGPPRLRRPAGGSARGLPGIGASEQRALDRSETPPACSQHFCRPPRLIAWAMSSRPFRATRAVGTIPMFAAASLAALAAQALGDMGSTWSTRETPAPPLSWLDAG
jgi:hypothetical protein